MSANPWLTAQVANIGAQAVRYIGTPAPDGRAKHQAYALYTGLMAHYLHLLCGPKG